MAENRAPDPNLMLLEPLLGPISVPSLSNKELGQRLDLLLRLRAAADGRILELLGEAGRRESYREDGATGTEQWVAERFGVSQPTARAYGHVAERVWDFPHLTGSLCEGEISFDKLRTVIGVATPETEQTLRTQAKTYSVHELGDLVRSVRADRGPALERRAEKDYELRSLRFNDQFRTVTAQLPPETYVETKSCLESRARELPTDGETPWDQRLCDAFLQTIRSSGGRGGGSGGETAGTYVVVAHVPLAALLDEDGETTDLAAARPCGGPPATQRSPSRWTTTTGAPCTKGGPGEIPQEPNGGRCGAETDIAASRAVPTRRSPTCTT
jgi:Domain of unknown function (DUF222)